MRKLYKPDEEGIRGTGTSVVFHGAALDIAREYIGDNSVDLIVTSPPYAMQRDATYGGIHELQYAQWFREHADEFQRILKPTGSMVLNIKEHSSGGSRSLYVYETIIALCEKGWHWVDDYIWRKKNSFPHKTPARLRDGWEHCYHLSPSHPRDLAFYPDAVSHWSREASAAGKPKNKSNSDAPFGTYRLGARPDPGWARPDNVLTIAAVTRNVGHPAAFPLELPRVLHQTLQRPRRYRSRSLSPAAAPQCGRALSWGATASQ